MSIFVANWKMNGDLSTISDFCAELQQNTPNTKHTVVCAFPDVYLSSAHRNLNQSPILLSSQRVSAMSNGAFTGQVSATMYKDIGCSYTLIGHSERRQIEDKNTIKKQIEQALEAELTPIICVGETLEEKKADKTKEVILSELNHYFHHSLPVNSPIIAYEPKWAIGTGLTPTDKEIKIVLESIRSKYSFPILYGGSVNSSNCKDILNIGLDGLLVGSASLDAKVFLEMVCYE